MSSLSTMTMKRVLFAAFCAPTATCFSATPLTTCNGFAGLSTISKEAAIQLVQVVLTDAHAGLLAAGADLAVRAHENDTLVTLTDEELDEYKRLAVFMTAVASDPSAFPVRESLARSLKKKAREMKGPAQPQSRRNQRKRTQARKQSFQRRNRAERREQAQAWNEAVAKIEAERIEHEEWLEQRRAELEAEPKFDITDIAGNVILAGVPQSFVKAQAEDKPDLILPPGVA